MSTVLSYCKCNVHFAILHYYRTVKNTTTVCSLLNCHALHTVQCILSGPVWLDAGASHPALSLLQPCHPQGGHGQTPGHRLPAGQAADWRRHAPPCPVHRWGDLQPASGKTEVVPSRRGRSHAQSRTNHLFNECKDHPWSKSYTE